MQAGGTAPILARGLGLEWLEISEIIDAGVIGRYSLCSTPKLSA